MSKKSDSYYFDTFITCAESACEAARMLESSLSSFDAAALPIQLDKMHAIEHTGDQHKHDMVTALMKAFITPIEREDIILLSQNIDEVTDRIEDVLIRVYINHVEHIRPDAIEFSKLVISCCEAVKSLLREFSDFKKSKKISQLIIEINELEAKGDQLFMNSMRALHTTCKEPLEIIAWREIFIYLEKCADACEHVADVVESVITKNS